MTTPVEIPCFFVNTFSCPECGSRGVIDVDVGRTLRHDCGWGGLVTTVLPGAHFCIEVDPVSQWITSLEMSLDDQATAIRKLVDLNLEFLKKYRPPSLFLTGIRYGINQSEARRGISELLGAASADEDELVAWRVAELRQRGRHADVRILWNDRGVPIVFVQLGDGTMELVSEMLKARAQ